MSTSQEERFVQRRFATPRVVMSACLEMEACRHDGQRIPDSFIRHLLPFVDLVPVCPEVEIGLGVPRETIRLVADGQHTRLVQPATERDLTESMHDFSYTYLATLGDVDGFILKSNSPSCGLKGVKVYASSARSQPIRKEAGLFARAVVENFGELAVETDGRLRNYPIRHHFLTKLFAFAQLRQLGPEPTATALSDFQRRHKHLLMTYDQEAMRALGAIAANSERRTLRENYDAYAERFRRALADPPAHGAYINSLTHMYGHFKNRLGRSETAEFFSMLDEYANHRLPLHALLAVLRSWCSRFEYAYFADQSLLEPYPRQLVQMRDSGKGLDF